MNEISNLESLLKKLHPYFDVVKKYEKEVVYCEIIIKLKKQEEIDALIRKLKSI